MALVVEDDDMAGNLLRLLLEAEGFNVLRAVSAAAALAQAPLQKLHLITVDLQLPDMDGWEFLSRLRELNGAAHVPVVVITSTDDCKMALSGGAASVLQKPISRAQLKASLSALGLEPSMDRTHTILIVDDDPKAVEVIAAFLPTPPYALVRAYGGREAVTLAQRVRPELIVLDLMMPEMNGFDVVAALQCNTQTASIPILIVTAKEITATDRQVLNIAPGKMIHTIEKSAFNSTGFVAEVRRALLPGQEAAHG